MYFFLSEAREWPSVLVGIFLGCHEVIRLDEHDIYHIYHNKVENWVRGIGERKTHFSWSLKTNLLSLRFWSTTFLRWASLTSETIIVYTSSKSFLQFLSLLQVVIEIAKWLVPQTILR